MNGWNVNLTTHNFDHYRLQSNKKQIRYFNYYSVQKVYILAKKKNKTIAKTWCSIAYQISYKVSNENKNDRYIVKKNNNIVRIFNKHDIYRTNNPTS